jgi:serine/threonine-protein kinase RsbT
MSSRIVSHIEIPIEEESDIVEVRQVVRNLSQEYGFDHFSQAAVITAASELGRNIWVHAGKGKAIIEVTVNRVKKGIKLEFQDEGPGIEDIDKAMQDGYSTAQSLGLGLSGTKRLVDEFDIESTPGKGTKVVICKWKT